MTESVFDGQQVAVAFCTPHRKVRLENGEEILDTVTVQWTRHRTALALGTNCNFIQLFEDGKEVGVARDSAARRCLAHRPRPRYLMFLDDDVLPMWDAFVKLFYRLQTNPNIDIAAGVYCVKGWHDPLVYAGDGCGPFWDWAVGDLLTTAGHGITGTHMGLTLIRTSLFQRMLDAKVVNDVVPFFKTVNETGYNCSRRGTEDLYFYQLARKVGCQIMVDTSVLAGHIDKNTGVTWGLPKDSPPMQRGDWLTKKDQEQAKAQDLKLALDIGAGGTRRVWAGHKTYTTDIRPDAKPDYVQDTRLLNLPDGHFDLVASSHHLEHLGRWDQPRVWSEMFRVLKAGGRMEHVVPSLDWAAAKLVDGEPDEHVYNVLYGAQEAHGYAREYNLHYFGYTAKVARALAEGCGLVEVRVRDWRDEPALGYNLVVTGRKPLPADAPVLPAATLPTAAAARTEVTEGMLVAGDGGVRGSLVRGNRVTSSRPNVVEGCRVISRPTDRMGVGNGEGTAW